MEAHVPDEADVMRELQGDYECNWQTIVELMSYNMGQIALDKVGMTPPEAKSVLASVKGREVLSRWQSIFSGGIARFVDFNSYRESGGEVDLSGWLSMSQSSGVAIESLRKALISTHS